MLNNVPIQISKSARLVTLNHPNAMDCTVYRKQVNRTADTTPAAQGGMPTIGGLGVLDSEDETDYSYVVLGSAKIVFTGQFMTEGNNWNEGDTQLTYPDMPVNALIECVLEPSEEGYFVPSNRDMVMVAPGDGMALSYEVSGETSNVNIPPFCKSFSLSVRSDATTGI